jgi:uncharacterized membrane protein
METTSIGTWGVVLLAILLAIALSITLVSPILAIVIAAVAVMIGAVVMVGRRQESDPSTPREARRQSEAAMSAASRRGRGAPVSGEGA